MYFKLVCKTKWPETTQPLARVYKNSDFLVQVYEPKDGAQRISINRTQYIMNDQIRPVWKDGITWDDIQAIKKALNFDHLWGVEIYPPEKHLINVANIRHIFLVEEKPPFAWENENEPKTLS